MAEITDSTLNTQATQPASATVDGRSQQTHPLPDVIQVLDRKAGVDALAGSNDSGGPKSGWGRLRTARAIPGD